LHHGRQPHKSFNGRLRDELLNETLFPSLKHARATLAAWRMDYNTERPHSRLVWQTPAAFAQTFTPQRGLTLRNPHKQAILKPGVSLTLDECRGQRQRHNSATGTPPSACRRIARIWPKVAQFRPAGQTPVRRSAG
jgi:putative transposase